MTADQFSIRYMDELDLMIISVHRSFSQRDLEAFLKNGVDPDRRSNIVWDVQRGSLYDISVDEFKEVTKERMPIWDQSPEGRLYIVTSSATENTLMRWFTEYINAMRGSPLVVHHVGSVEDVIERVKGAQGE